eukprot:3236599-Prymnesium_polylepis.1
MRTLGLAPALPPRPRHPSPAAHHSRHARTCLHARQHPSMFVHGKPQSTHAAMPPPERLKLRMSSDRGWAATRAPQEGRSNNAAVPFTTPVWLRAAASVQDECAAQHASYSTAQPQARRAARAMSATQEDAAAASHKKLLPGAPAAPH